MKVLNIIDFILLSMMGKIEYLQYIGYNAIYDPDMDFCKQELEFIFTYTKFLNKDFDIDILITMFDHWKKYYIMDDESGASGISFSNDIVMLKYMDGSMWSLYDLKNNQHMNHFFVFPKTLHEFIINCEEANVELLIKNKSNN